MSVICSTILANNFTIYRYHITPPFILISETNITKIWIHCSCSFSSKSRSISFQFPQKQGAGIRKLLPHVSPECLELIELMCTYDPDERYSFYRKHFTLLARVIYDSLWIQIIWNLWVEISVIVFPNRISARQALRHHYFKKLRWINWWTRLKHFNVHVTMLIVSQVWFKIAISFFWHFLEPIL